MLTEHILRWVGQLQLRNPALLERFRRATFKRVRQELAGGEHDETLSPQITLLLPDGNDSVVSLSYQGRHLIPKGTHSLTSLVAVARAQQRKHHAIAAAFSAALIVPDLAKTHRMTPWGRIVWGNEPCYTEWFYCAFAFGKHLELYRAPIDRTTTGIPLIGTFAARHAQDDAGTGLALTARAILRGDTVAELLWSTP